MAIVTSRQELMDYCLRALGAPVIEINVDYEQLEDRIDDAIEYFRMYHYDGIEKLYLKHQITQQDIDQQYIDVPSHIYGITKVFPLNTSITASNSLFNLQYQLRLNDLFDLSSASIIYYSQAMSHLSLLDFQLNGPQMFRFNALTGKLYIEARWGTELALDQIVLVEAYRALDPEDTPKMYNDIWFKKYTTALFKKTWAANLSKYSGMTLPGGLQIDGQSMYDVAVSEIAELEQDLQSKSAPLEFFVG